MKADLHNHSTFSDGLFNINDLIYLANEKGLDYISITDHDDINSLNYKSPKLIYGIELSTKRNGEDIHILGYFKNLNHLDELKSYLSKMVEKRKKRLIEINKRLKKYYDIDLDLSNILKKNKGTVGRPHLAALISKKYNIPMKEAFEKYLSNESMAYIPSSNLSPIEGVNLLKRSNCLVSIAHPILYKKNKLEDLILNVDAIEAIYPNNLIEDTNYYKDFAKKNNLLITAGSDFHGDDKHFDMKTCILEGEDLIKFLKALNKL